MILSLFALLLLFITSNAHADETAPDQRQETDQKSSSPPRGGFFQRTYLSTGGHFLSSKDNILSGFSQQRPSSSRAGGWGISAEFGGGIGPHLAFAGYFTLAQFSGIRAQVDDTSVALKDVAFSQIGVGASLHYFFFEDWYASVRLGFLSQQMLQGPLLDGASPPGFSDADLAGPSSGLSAGRDWRLINQLWGGLEARLDMAALGEDIKSLNTYVLMPQVSLHLMWF